MRNGLLVLRELLHRRLAGAALREPKVKTPDGMRLEKELAELDSRRNDIIDQLCYFQAVELQSSLGGSIGMTFRRENCQFRYSAWETGTGYRRIVSAPITRHGAYLVVAEVLIGASGVELRTFTEPVGGSPAVPDWDDWRECTTDQFTSARAQALNELEKAPELTRRLCE